MKGVDRIFKDYPNVTFTTIGALIPQYKRKWGRRYNHDFGDTDVYTWIKKKYPGFMDQTDIFVTPLDVNVYNRSKSCIKWLEVSAARIPGVWQRIRQYENVIKEGENGFLATYADHWYYAIKKLIENPKLRRKIGNQAFRDVKNGWQIQDNIKRYADFFKKVLDGEDL